MKVIVEFTNASHTTARVVVQPGWLRRMFGARSRTGDVEHQYICGSHDWVFSTTKRKVGHVIVRALELQDVAPPPVARVERGA